MKKQVVNSYLKDGYLTDREGRRLISSTKFASLESAQEFMNQQCALRKKESIVDLQFNVYKDITALIMASRLTDEAYLDNLQEEIGRMTQ